MELEESSEIDFWNAPLYCQRASYQYHKKDLLTSEINLLVIQLENIHKQLEKKEHIPGGVKYQDEIIEFSRKVKSLAMSSSSELTALKLLSKLSTFNDLECKSILESSGLMSLVQKKEENDSFQVFLEAWKILNNIENEKNGCIFLEGVYPIFPAFLRLTPAVDIVLIHGIMGGVARTWRQHDSMGIFNVFSQKSRMELFKLTCRDYKNDCFDKCYTWMWPLDWLTWSIKKPCRLIAVDYPAYWWKWPYEYEQIHDKSLNVISEEFLQKLKAAGVGSRPIIWITHSMGGLMLKRMLELERILYEENGKSSDFLSSTKGVVFLSVPHFGSPLASWSCYFPSIMKPSQYIYDMKADSPQLLSLHESFLKICEEYNIKILTLNEGYPSQIGKHGPKFTFVPSRYGNPGVGEFYEMAATHLEVCKPVDKSDRIYRLIVEFISKVMETV